MLIQRLFSTLLLVQVGQWLTDEHTKAVEEEQQTLTDIKQEKATPAEAGEVCAYA